MSKEFQANDPSRRWKGIAIVVAVHVLIGWALISGMARSGLNLLKKPLEAVVIQEVIIPPPPPPPPPTKEIKQPDVKVAAPPPPFVPPPDVAPPVTTSAPTIVATAVAPPPAPVVIAPPSPQAPPKPAPNLSDLRVACPTQVAPEMPSKAIQDGTEGIVKASALIKDGVIKEITILSGPRVFHAAVKAAMKQYKCATDSGEVVATQEFVFKLQ
jgi:protein TonB